MHITARKQASTLLCTALKRQVPASSDRSRAAMFGCRLSVIWRAAIPFRPILSFRYHFQQAHLLKMASLKLSSTSTTTSKQISRVNFATVRTSSRASSIATRTLSSLSQTASQLDSDYSPALDTTSNSTSLAPEPPQPESGGTVHYDPCG
jgi:hypothetical protein